MKDSLRICFRVSVMPASLLVYTATIQEQINALIAVKITSTS